MQCATDAYVKEYEVSNHFIIVYKKHKLHCNNYSNRTEIEISYVEGSHQISNCRYFEGKLVNLHDCSVLFIM